MRVKCETCGHKANINSRNEIDPKVVDLYCTCSNPECGHYFVVKLIFSHSIAPSRRHARQTAFNFLRSLAPEEQQTFLNQARVDG
ncbi:ogr/Delta-like zinc finger family protein [uncultured Microbulbifer sp.]|uniref:ogr/Delta-like zinc finger family protein n=1 Tax=uncultured Microbulbifer sp. TaxID=348147 RepID=UPI00344D96E3